VKEKRIQAQKRGRERKDLKAGDRCNNNNISLVAIDGWMKKKIKIGVAPGQ